MFLGGDSPRATRHAQPRSSVRAGSFTLLRQRPPTTGVGARFDNSSTTSISDSAGLRIAKANDPRGGRRGAGGQHLERHTQTSTRNGWGTPEGPRLVWVRPGSKSRCF